MRVARCEHPVVGAMPPKTSPPVTNTSPKVTNTRRPVKRAVQSIDFASVCHCGLFRKFLLEPHASQGDALRRERLAGHQSARMID